MNNLNHNFKRLVDSFNEVYQKTIKKELEEEPKRCDECGGLVSDDGWTIDPNKCCYYCKMD